MNKTIYILRLCVFFLLFSSLPSYLTAERIGGTVAEIFRVKANEEVEGSFKLRELVGIDFENSDLIKGIEIRVDVPEPVMEFRESFLFRIFSNLDEDPDNSIKYYYGNEVLKKTFPKDRTLDVAIPLSGDDVWAPDSLGVTTVDPPISREQFPLLLTIEPEMKGIPQRVSEAPFEFTVKPVLYDRGKLSLILPEDSNEEELTVEIDGDTFSPTKDMYTLKTGIHELTVSSPSTNPFSTTFGIEQGEITKIKAELEPARSYISFEAPEGAEVYFNGKKIEKEDHRNFTAEPGEHVVLVKLDDYSLSKNFQLKRGKNYKISLFFDILVEED